MQSETKPFTLMTMGKVTANSISFTALLLTLSLVVLLVGCNSETDTFEVEGFPFVIQSQEVKARIWKDLEMEPVNVLDADAGVQRPRMAFDDEHGNLFTIDYGDSRVKKFDADGKLVRTYGDGGEQALGQHGQPPTALSLGPEGNVWVAEENKLIIFEETGQWLRSILLDFKVSRLEHLSDGRYYVYPRGNRLRLQEGQFYLFDNDEPVTRFGATELDLTTAVGEIEIIGNDLLHSPARFEFIVRYNEEGDIIYARETIEQAPASVIEEKGRNSIFHMPMLKSSIGHYDGRLYIDAWILSDIKGTVVIDVYRASDGSYEYSIELPEEKHSKSSGMTIGRGMLYALRKNAIAIYRLPSIDSPHSPGE